MFINNAKYYLKETISSTATVGGTFKISTDFETSSVLETGTKNVSIKLINGTQIERMTITATGGVATIVKRGIKQDDTETNDVLLQKTWNDGSIIIITAFASDMIDKSEGSQVAVYATATARNNAIVTPLNGMSCYVTDEGIFYDYTGGAWSPRASGSSVNASLTVAGKVEIATQGEVDAGIDTGGSGAYVGVIPSTFNTGITNKIASQVEAEAGTDNTKLMTPLRVQNKIDILFSQYGDASDGNVTITTTITLTRDMYYNNLTVNSPGILNPNGYKVYVKGTLSGNGTINRNGNNASNQSAGTILNQGSLNAETQAPGGVFGGTTIGNNGTSINPGYSNINGVSGGNGYQTSGGSGGISTRGILYNTALDFKKGIKHLINPCSSDILNTIQYKGPATSGSGAGSNGASSGSSGGAGGNGGVIWVCAYSINFTGTITSIGGNGGDATIGQWYLIGGGGGGQGGIIYLIAKTFTSIGTQTLTGGTGGNGVNGGTNGANGNTGTTIQITI